MDDDDDDDDSLSRKMKDGKVNQEKIEFSTSTNKSMTFN
jgi:hypothetical protein